MCLSWNVLFQYCFKRVTHINVNEELSYRSLIKLFAKREPVSRFGVLDSRVAIGCNAKGRSSSQKLNFYLSTAFPKIIGGALYPSLFHIGNDFNVSDDPSRLRPLRPRVCAEPEWLQRLLKGAPGVVKLADDRDGAWPVGAADGSSKKEGVRHGP